MGLVFYKYVAPLGLGANCLVSKTQHHLSPNTIGGEGGKGGGLVRDFKIVHASKWFSQLFSLFKRMNRPNAQPENPVCPSSTAMALAWDWVWVMLNQMEEPPR